MIRTTVQIDPEVTERTKYRQEILEALKAVPLRPQYSVLAKRLSIPLGTLYYTWQNIEKDCDIQVTITVRRKT